MSGNLPQANGSSSSPTYEQELEIKRVGYMRELAENYMEAVEEVVRDTQLDVSHALLNILLSPPCPMAGYMCSTIGDQGSPKDPANRLNSS